MRSPFSLLLQFLLGLSLTTGLLAPDHAAAGLVRDTVSSAYARVRATCARLLSGSPFSEEEDEERWPAETGAIVDKVHARLGYVPRIDASRGRVFIFPVTKIKAYDQASVKIGKMIVAHETARRVFLLWIETVPAHRQKGISELMFACALARLPRVTRIHTTLNQINELVVRQHLRDGKTCREAVLHSPTALMAARFGFTKLVHEPDCDGKVLRLRLERGWPKRGSSIDHAVRE